jgi:DNA-directed RNA polymerase subunit M/transcription elongation factor TFIIS
VNARRQPAQAYGKIIFERRASRRSSSIFGVDPPQNRAEFFESFHPPSSAAVMRGTLRTHSISGEIIMAVGAKIAKTADRKKVMDTTKSTDCPKCGKPTRIVKRVKDRERGVPGGIYISCSACEFFEKL